MELYQQILTRIFSKGQIEVVFPDLPVETAYEIVELECCLALQKIMAIIQDDCLNDHECYTKIEEIVSTLEDLGADCGGRHDFG